MDSLPLQAKGIELWYSVLTAAIGLLRLIGNSDFMHKLWSRCCTITEGLPVGRGRTAPPQPSE